jgi:hypothetical protein
MLFYSKFNTLTKINSWKIKICKHLIFLNISI